MRWELAPPRHVQSRTRNGPESSSAWLAVALLVKVAVAAWHHGEETWVHWAAPLESDGAAEMPLRRCDLGRRAMRPGAPPGYLESSSAWRLDEPAARLAIARALSEWAPELHRQPEIGVVSSLDENLGDFRRRCLAPLRPFLQPGDGGSGAATAWIADRIESRLLGADEIDVRLVRFGALWFPPGEEPTTTAADRMIAGGVRGR